VIYIVTVTLLLAATAVFFNHRRAYGSAVINGRIERISPPPRKDLADIDFAIGIVWLVLTLLLCFAAWLAGVPVA
jgi:hypothetical protein